jgi:hypothetical protein
MLNDHIYNLLAQLSEEHKSLWRMKNQYLKDAGDCADCQAFWKKMVADKENHIEELMQLFKKHTG